ncbi:MAG: AAA family ATPase [Methylibium sp.]|nr:AAA family ATPase [Methylibium sp.]
MERKDRFCSGCGARLDDEAAPGLASANRPPQRTPSRRRSAAAKPADERKHASLLFADVCDSTAHVASIDPEEAQAYFAHALGLMSEAVEAYGGTVSRPLGDGQHFLFGAPVAHEDHALRACLAAIAMQRRAREQSRADRPLLLRVGIHSGEVVLGLATETPTPYYRADGIDVHIAARLAEMAAPGTVLVSEATRRLVADQLDMVALGPHAVRGLGRELELHELSMPGERSVAGPLARRRHLGPLVGRAQGLAVLEGAAAQVRAQGLRIVGVRGDAGIGKSRLLAEFSAGLCQRGFRGLTIAARSYATHVPYTVVADLICGLMSLPLDADLPRKRESALAAMAAWPASADPHRAVVIDLLNLGHAESAWLALTPSQRRREIVPTVHWLLARAVAAGPLVLVIDDIFLADRDSQRLLESLAPRLESLPVLLCVSYRQDFVHRWTNSPRFVEQWLGPLHADEAKRLARALLGSDVSLRTVLEALIERADGNPFFLEQMVMTLIDDGTLVGTPGAYRCARPAAQLRVPGSIAAVIEARVDRLAPAAKSALEAAAIVGDAITAELIGHMQRVDARQAGNHLLLALSAGLLADTAHGEAPGYAFRHAVVREVVAGALTGPRRKLLHRAALGALQERFADPSADPSADPLADRAAVLAHHAYAGEAWAEAAEFARRAMARSVARSANRDALRMFDLGLDAARRLGTDAPALRAELGLRLEALGALLPLGQVDAIVANLERAEALTRELGDARRLAGVQLQLAATLWTRGSYRQGLGAAADALRTAQAAGSRSVEMSALQARLLLEHGLGRYREVLTDADMIEREFAVELAARQILPGWAVIASVNVKVFRADVLCRMDRMAEAQQACDDAYGELDSHEHAFSRVLVDFVQGEILMAQQRPAEAARRLDAALHLCRVHDLPTMHPPILAALCGATALAGQAAEAVRSLEQAITEQLYLAGGRYNEFYFHKNLAIARAAAGRFDEAIAAAEQALVAATTFEQHGHAVDALLLLAEIECSAGRVESARAHFDEVRSRAVPCAMNRALGRATAWLAALALQGAPTVRADRAGTVTGANHG